MWGYLSLTPADAAEWQITPYHESALLNAIATQPSIIRLFISPAFATFEGVSIFHTSHCLLVYFLLFRSFTIYRKIVLNHVVRLVDIFSQFIEQGFYIERNVPHITNIKSEVHSVVALGWAHDDSGELYIHIQNSWGSEWGEDGTAYVHFRSCVLKDMIIVPMM